VLGRRILTIQTHGSPFIRECSVVRLSLRSSSADERLARKMAVELHPIIAQTAKIGPLEANVTRNKGVAAHSMFELPENRAKRRQISGHHTLKPQGWGSVIRECLTLLGLSVQPA